MAPANDSFLAPDTAAPPPTSSSALPQRVALDVAQIPLAFVANSGQTDQAVRFQTRGMNGSIFFTPNEIAVTLPVNHDRIPSDKLRFTDNPRSSGVERRTAVLRLRYDGANPTPTLKSAEQLPGTTNYLLGNRPERWRTNLTTYAGVVYQQLYPGIDLRYAGTDGRLKSTYTVAPGADPARIRWHYQGATKLQVDPKTGDLQMTLAAPQSRTGIVTPTTLVEHAPIAWQTINGQHVPVEVAYTLRNAVGRPTTADQTPTAQLRVGFAIGAYDASQPLIIDPTLTYSTYLGGSSNQDRGWGIAADDAGNSYIVGATWSTDFPTTTLPLQPASAGNGDIFIAKLNTDGDALIYSTYLGGSGPDEGYGIVVDDDGNATITGYTQSAGFPTTVGALQPTCAVYFYACQYTDAFVAKLNADGDGLIYSTFLGGNDIDRGYGIALDDDGNAYVTGLTWSPDFPTTIDAPQPSGGGNWDGFIAKIDDTASNLVYATYVHGSNYDQATAIAVDGDDNAYVTGYTSSTNIPTTTGALQETSGGNTDAFLIKLNAAGTAWDYSTYLGGTYDDYGYGVAVDGDGHAYVTGMAWSVNFPTTAQAAQRLWNQDTTHTNYNPDAFVTKFNSAGDGLIYSTYLGGAYSESGRSITLDGTGRAVIAGWTTSYDFPTTTDAAQLTAPGNYNGFVAMLAADGQRLRHGTYLGGDGADFAYAAGLDDDGNIYVTGETASNNFSTSGVVQPLYGGNIDAFATKIAALPVVTPTVFLSAMITPTIGAVNDQSLSLVVEARDANGDLVTGYLGAVDLIPSAPTSGLPYSWGADYTFTTLDAGRHVFNNWSFNWTGTHVVDVQERNPATVGATSNSVTVGPITLSAVITPTTVFATEPILSLVIEARDAGGNLAQGYRGSLNIDPSASTSGLPQSMLGGAADYTFTALDAGRHVFSDWSFNIVGTQAITVTDRDVPTRQAVTNNVSVEQVYLTAAITPTAAFAGEPILALAIEARDAGNNLVPGYRGALDIEPSATATGLPQSTFSTPDYVFTAGDAGQHVFEDIAFYAAGTQAITVTDRGDSSRSAVSNTVNISDVHFVAVFEPDSAYYNDKVLTMTLEVLDDSDQLVCGYRGGVNLNPSVPMINLPQSTFDATADYVFTEEDCGRHVFPDLAFTSNGDQSVTVVDRGDPSRSSTSNGVTISDPPDPTPPQAAPPPMSYTLPLIAIDPPPIELSWGKPFLAIYPVAGLNGWEGFPKHPVPTKPGALYIISGVVQRSPLSWWPTTLYPCVYMGWESQLTGTRLAGGFLWPHDDPTFAQGAGSGCSGVSSYGNNGAADFFLPLMVNMLAPWFTKGFHINVQGAGNTDGSIAMSANNGLGDRDCGSKQEAVHAGDPIDTRDGAFFLYEHDLGIATGCQEVALRFERSYDTFHSNKTALSSGWVHNYEQRIMVQGDYAIVQRPRGAYLMFKDVGGDVYAAPAGDSHRLLKRSGGGWALLYRDRRADLFDANGRLIAQQDPNGNLIWMTYEPYSRDGISGTRLARVDAPGGRYLWMGYDYYLPSRLTVVGDNSGRRVRYGYDDLGRLETATDPLGGVATYAYSSTLWLMTSKTDALGHTTFTNTYDQDGRVIHQTNSMSQELSLSYQLITDTAEIQTHVGTAEAAGLAALFVTTVTDQTSGQAEYVYGDDGLLRLATDFAGATTRYRGYTAARQPTEVEDALGHVTEISYNASGLPIRIINALDQRAFVTYDSWGNPTVLTDTLGHAYTFTYDGPNLTLVETAAGQQIALGYQDQAGWQQMLSSIVHSGSLTTTLEYNTPGDLTTVTDALGRVTSLNYDAAGRPITIVDPQGITTTLDYDATDRIYRTTQSAHEEGPVGELLQRTTVLTYNALGNITSITDPLSRTISYQYDPAGRLTHQIMPDSRVITFTYDVQQRQMTLAPPGRPEHSFTFSPMDLVEDYLPPQIGLGDQDTTATYDLLQQLTGLERPDGSSLAFGYDPIGRTTAITSTQGVLQASYDPANGELDTLTMPDGGTLTYAYDADGRPTALTWGGTLTGTVQLTPTLQGQLAAQRVNSAPSISFAYDAAGMVTQAGDLSITSDPARDRLIGSTLGVITDTWGYNAFNEPRQYQSAISDTAALTFQYQRDASSRIISKTETISGTTSVYSYTYDLAGQLTEVWQDGTRTAEYTYDSNGNRLSISGPGGTITGSYNAQDQLLQYGTSIYTYTLNGELDSATTSGQTTSYSYDDFGNLTGVVLPDSTAITYMLDGEGRRIGKKVDGTLVQGFLYQDALRPIAELDGAGNIASQFVYATRSNVPDYLVKNGRTYRILADQLGGPRLVVDAQTGQVAQRLDYDVFGAIILNTNPGFQPFGFAGGLYDQDTQLTHFGAREYDAETGRWTSKDPLLFGGGDTNLYRYVGNDPVNFVDPSGHLPQMVLVGIGMALVGMAMGITGSIIGQLISNGFCWNKIDWGNVGIAGLVGGLAGALYPFTAGSLPLASLLGGGASLLQYGLTEISNGATLTIAGASQSILFGLLWGGVGGAFTRASVGRVGHASLQGVARSNNALKLASQDLRANTSVWPISRAMTANTGSNTTGLGDECRCE